jgi:uncharacterized repeat protein (TIGR01451 family)
VLNTTKTLAQVNGAAATASSQVKGGDVLIYDVTVANTGGTAGTTNLSDPVPANTFYTGIGEGWSCPAQSGAGTACAQQVVVAGNNADTVHYTVTVVSPLPTGTTRVVNTVSAPGTQCSSCTPSVPTVAELHTAKLLLSINGKIPTASQPIFGGDLLIYGMTVTNAGGSDGTTTLSDPVPANTIYSSSTEGWSCSSGSVAGTACTHDVTVAAGGSQSVTYTVTVVRPLPAETTAIANQVKTSSGACDTCGVTNPPAKPGLNLVKKAGTPIDVNGNGITDAGDTIAYTFDVTNTGNVAISGITVNDSLLSGVTCPQATLAVGAS